MPRLVVYVGLNLYRLLLVFVVVISGLRKMVGGGRRRCCFVRNIVVMINFVLLSY